MFACNSVSVFKIQHEFNIIIVAKQEKIDELAKLVKENDERHKQLNTELQSKDIIIADLKKQLKHNERKFLEELKKKNQQVLALKVELDNKGSTIAYLTTEMHRIKIIHKNNSDALALTSSSPSPPSGDQISRLRTRDSLHISKDGLTDIPISPPSGDQATRRRQRKTSASEIRSRPITAKGSNKPRPDAELFLARAAPIEPETESVAVKPTPPVLPPITPGGEDQVSKKAFSRRQQLLRRRVELKSQPEYGKLAVDKITSNSNTWVHEPNTTTK